MPVSSKMYMKFTINLVFWEMFKKRSPNSASNIQPQYTEEVQTFSVDLYESQIKKLNQPVDLESFMETMGTNGQRVPTPEEREANQAMQKIMPCLLYTSPSPRDATLSRMPSSA